MPSQNSALDAFTKGEYKYGFKTDIGSQAIPPGLSEKVIHHISDEKNEPDFIRDFRLRAFRRWQETEEPRWAYLDYPPIDFQKYRYYAVPEQKKKLSSLDEVDPRLLDTFNRLGVPITEQKRLANVAVDAVFDSVSVATTFKDKLKKAGVIFCSISEAIQEYPELIKRYLGSVVPYSDNFYAALNSAVFSDGSIGQTVFGGT